MVCVFVSKPTDIFAYLQVKINLDIKLDIAFNKFMNRFT